MSSRMILAVSLVLSAVPLDAAAQGDLDYRQKSAVKSGNTYMDRYEADLKRHEEEVGKCAVDSDVYNSLRVAGGGMRALEQLGSRLQGVIKDLQAKKCPADHKDVKALIDRVQAANKKLLGLHADYKLVHKRAQDAWKPETYPDLKKDRDELERIVKLLTVKFETQEEWNQYVEIRNGLPKWLTWIDEMEKKKYSKFLSGAARVKEANEFQRKVKYARSQYRFMSEKVEKILQQFIMAERMNLAQVQRFVRARNARAFEKGQMGLVCLGKAKLILAALEEILGAKHETVTQFAQQYEETRKAAASFSQAAKAEAQANAHKEIVDKLTQHEKTLAGIVGSKSYQGAKNLRHEVSYLKSNYIARFAKIVDAGDARLADVTKRSDAILEKLKTETPLIKERVIVSNTAAKDVYAGSDKDEMKQVVLNAWKKSYPKHEALEVRFHASDWRRSTEWKSEWRDKRLVTWKVDRSYLYLFVVAKVDDRLCEKILVTYTKDHMAGDKRYYSLPHGVTGNVYETMLIANLNK